MPVLANDNLFQDISQQLGGEDPYVLIRDVMLIQRQHFPRNYVPLHLGCRGKQDCRVVEGKDIEQYTITGEALWASYRDIVAGQERLRSDLERRGKPLKRYLYKPEAVFSDHKILIAEDGRRVKAVACDYPVYPDRGKLGIVRRDTSASYLYLALGVLNSAIGHYLYIKILGSLNIRKRSDGISKVALDQIPIAHKHSSIRDRMQVATLAYQLNQLSLAESAIGLEFNLQRDALRERLLCSVAKVLQFGERETEAIRTELRGCNFPDLPNLFFPPDELVPYPVRLPSGQPPNASDQDGTALIRSWEERINHPSWGESTRETRDGVSLSTRVQLACRSGLVHWNGRCVDLSPFAGQVNEEAPSVADLLVENRG